MRARVLAVLPSWLVEKVPRDHMEPDEAFGRRRRVVSGVTAAGAALLGVSLSTRPGSMQFYATSAGVAATWVVGGFASGPLHLGWIEGRDQTLRRPWVTPIATGAGAFGFFYACALVSRRIPFLDTSIRRVLQFAEQGNMPLVLLTTYANGLGEEVFFRGALYAALPPRQAVVASTAVYALATVTTRNPSLVLAATVMGSLFALQRRASGGLQAPVLTGVVAFGVFYGCAVVVRQIPVLDRAISSVLTYADEGDDRAVLLTTLANGAAEEVFFRGALYAAIGQEHPVALSTAAYALATVTTRNPALVLAATVMGTLFAAQRRASGGIQAPVLTHLTWSVLMLRYLPPLFRRQEFPPV